MGQDNGQEKQSLRPRRFPLKTLCLDDRESLNLVKSGGGVSEACETRGKGCREEIAKVGVAEHGKFPTKWASQK